MQVREQVIELTIPKALKDFAARLGGTLLPITDYFFDREATQYPELQQFTNLDEQGLTFKLSRYGFNNNQYRAEMIEFINILRKDNNIKLTSLLAACGYIDDAGAEALTDFIKTTTTLKVLDIHFSRISEKGIQYLIDALKINTSLTHLNIRSNALTSVLFQNLLELFEKYNFSVRQICIVQRTSCPADWKPSVDEEKKLHDLIIRNAKELPQKKGARRIVCGFMNEPFFEVLPPEIRLSISQWAMFSQFNNLQDQKVKNLMDCAIDDYNNTFKKS